MLASLFDNFWSLYTFHSIINEMDEPTNKLIGHHSYCTQVSELCTHLKPPLAMINGPLSPIGSGEFVFNRQSCLQHS